MKPTYLYDLDDRPALQYLLIYGFQWAFIMFPALVITASLAAGSLGSEGAEKMRFLQLTLLISGLFTFIQTLWGHRYPLLEGPATALVLAFILLAPHGIRTIQGGMILGGSLLMVSVLSRQLQKLIRLFTPNVVGVILMLIAFGLLRPLMGFMSGAMDGESNVGGETFLLSVVLALFIATLSHWLTGFLKTISVLIGMIAGSLFFYALGRLTWQDLAGEPWFSFSGKWVSSLPEFYWPAGVAFACAYLAVMVNTLGSLQGIAAITSEERLAKGIERGIFFNGVAGVISGLLGVVGTVSYSMSPGVILINRVASRFAVTYCGAIMLLAAFLPKLAALLAMVPSPVVGAALCVGLGGQVGVGISTVASQELTSRDYFVVGLPAILGTVVGFLPQEIFEGLPGALRVFVGNSLVIGIALVLFLEHLLLRKRKGGTP